ncbi:MAG TPA: tetratricopeptide repeat protein [Kofleriaceae bacterium]|nr:tetratricopeptide repeat protein [Kofleriaceae bacterium]
MTKRAAPPPGHGESVEVEIDAMDLAEWESGQSTPQASDANLAELVRRSAPPPDAAAAGVARTVSRERARTQVGVPVVRPPSQGPRTTPPGPAPKPTRAKSAAAVPPLGTPAPSTAKPPGAAAAGAPAPIQSRAASAPAPHKPPRAPTPVPGGIDFSLPVTAPGEPDASSAVPVPVFEASDASQVTATAVRARPAKPPRAPTPVPGGIDFSLPVTATSAPDAPAPGKLPRAPTPVPGGIDFSLPVTATSAPDLPVPSKGPRVPTPAPGAIDFSSMSTVHDAPRRLPLPPGPAELDFSLPATATGAQDAPTRVIAPPARGRTPGPAGAGVFAPPATATSDSGARPPEATPPPGAFAEPSRLQPVRSAFAGPGTETSTAWPPRPVPSDPSLPPDRIAAPDAGAQQPEHIDGAERLQVLTRRRLWWIGGAVGGLSIAAVIAAALIGPSSDGAPDEAPVQVAQVAARAAAAASDRELAAAAPAGARPPVAGAASPGPRAGAAPPPRSGAGAAIASRATPAAGNPGAASPAERPGRPAVAASDATPAAHHGHAANKPGPRRVVVDYATRPSETAPGLVEQDEEDPAIGVARAAYTAGNQRLFVGDLDGAVRAYQQALELYPEYVGGYRGLGLAYAELGDRASALAALKSYVAAAPSARDVALIKKRIARLQRK